MRNSLASRIGIKDTRPQEPPKKRLRFVNVPLHVSDFTLEDMVKEFAEPIFSNIYDHKDSRTAVFEFENPGIMEKVVEKYNSTPLEGTPVTVEIFEQDKRLDARRRNHRDSRRGANRGGRGGRGSRGSRGSHYKRREKPATEEQLDAELENYMKSS